MAIFDSFQRQSILDLQTNMLNEFGWDCKLIYQSGFISAPTNLQPANNTYFGNTGLTGSPVGSFDSNEGNTGQMVQNVSDTIKLSINWNPKKHLKVATDIQLPYSVILVRGFLNDLPKLQKAIEIQVNIIDDPTIVGKYKYEGEGIDGFNISQGNFFVAMLTRIA